MGWPTRDRRGCRGDAGDGAGLASAVQPKTGLAGLEKIREGRGRKPSIPEETVAEIVRLTTTTTPPGATHWSCRTMAKQVGVSSATVQRIWSDLGLQPHRVETFKVSNDPKFDDKLIDVVGLVSEPAGARRSCCAWTRSPRSRLWTAPRRSLPMVPGRAGTMTHDYKRNGTTTLVRRAGRADRQGHRPVPARGTATPSS